MSHLLSLCALHHKRSPVEVAPLSPINLSKLFRPAPRKTCRGTSFPSIITILLFISSFIDFTTLLKDVSIISYFSGPFTVAIVWLPLDVMYLPDCSTANERIINVFILDIFAPSTLILIFIGSFVKSCEGLAEVAWC